MKQYLFVFFFILNVWSDKKLLFALGYGLQDLKRLREYSTSHFVSSYEESLNYHCLSVKLGVVFLNFIKLILPVKIKN